MVLEVNLDDLIRESEHDSMPCSHPLLNVNEIFDLSILWTIFRVLGHQSFWSVVAFEIAPEVLKEGDFLLELLGVFCKCVLCANVLSVARSSFHVVDMVTVWVQDYLG